MDFETYKKKIKERSQSLVVTLNDKITGKPIKFITPSELALWRAHTLYVKEPITIEWIRKFDSNKIFFDVGANVGMYSIFAAIISNVKVLSFEPESNNFQILMENIFLNNLKNKIDAYPLGLSNTTALTKLYMSTFEKGQGHHSVGESIDHNLKPKKTEYEQGIFTTTLNDLVNKWKLPIPNYLKIDVDGIEYKIVSESSYILKDISLESVLIEINPNREEDKTIIDTLRTLGFSYDEEQVKKATQQKGPFKGYAEYLFKKRNS